MRLEFRPPDLNPAVRDLALLKEEFTNLVVNWEAYTKPEEVFKAGQLIIKRFKSLNTEDQKFVVQQWPQLVRNRQHQGPLDLSSIGFVGMMLGFMVADDAVRTRFLEQDSRWGNAFNTLNPWLDNDLESIWTHGSITGLTMALSIFLYEKVKREWPNIKANQSIDWTIPVAALGLSAAGANAYDTHQVINGAQPVVGMAIDNTLRNLGLESGLEPEQTNVAYEVSVAASVALLNFMIASRRKVFAVQRIEIPFSKNGVACARNEIAGRAMGLLSRLPQESYTIPGII